MILQDFSWNTCSLSKFVAPQQLKIEEPYLKQGPAKSLEW